MEFTEKSADLVVIEDTIAIGDKVCDLVSGVNVDEVYGLL